MILTTSFYDMNQKIDKKKRLFPKFQLIPISRFQVMHDYVCFIAPIDYRWIKSCVQDFLWKLLSFSYWNDLSQIPLRNCGSTEICKKIKFWKFWECHLFNISEYAFKQRWQSSSCEAPCTGDWAWESKHFSRYNIFFSYRFDTWKVDHT